MILLPSLRFEKSESMEDFLLNMDSQLRFYLWTISEMNAIKCTNDLHSFTRNQLRVSHYKKRWRDRYIRPDTKPLNFEDPLKMMSKLVNDYQTYDHVMAFNRILSHITEDRDPNRVQQIVDNKAIGVRLK